MVSQGSATLTLTGNVTATGSASIEGNLSLGGLTRTFDVAGGEPKAPRPPPRDVKPRQAAEAEKKAA